MSPTQFILDQARHLLRDAQEPLVEVDPERRKEELELRKLSLARADEIWKSVCFVAQGMVLHSDITRDWGNKTKNHLLYVLISHPFDFMGNGMQARLHHCR